MVLWATGVSPRVRRHHWAPTSPIGFATPISHRSDGYLATRVSRIFRSKRKDRAIDLLQRLDPKITNIELLTPEDPDMSLLAPATGAAATLHLDYEGVGLVPVNAMGDGMRRALHLAALVTELERGGALLIDEIEVGMHTSVLRDVFGWLCRSCRDAGIQMFATTHSLEAVDAILEGVPPEDLVLYRLEQGKARRFGGELLQISRLELGQEVR
jgi:predicted ATPase